MVMASFEYSVGARGKGYQPQPSASADNPYLDIW